MLQRWTKLQTCRTKHSEHSDLETASIIIGAVFLFAIAHIVQTFKFDTMRTLKTILTPLVVIVLLSSFSPYSRNPAGTLSVPGLANTFLDKTEVTNIAWKEYLFDLKEKYGASSEEYQQHLPDIILWEMAYGQDFFSSKTYDEYPLVGISFQQATDYCRWRSERVSEKENRKIEYSLPSLREYKVASRGKTENKMAEGLYSTSFGFRSFSGICENASEMTNQEGISIAGSNRVNCLDLREYIEPTPSLGFRCMAVLK